MRTPSQGGTEPRRQDGPGYLLGQGRIEQLAARARAFRTSPRLLGVTRAEIYVGSACNLACTYCNSRHRREPPWAPGALEDLIDNLAATGTRHLQWTGGEATLHPSLPALVARATALGMDSSISTNGTADPAVYQALVDAGMGRFYFSLDLLEARAFDRETGSQGMLTRVVDNIVRLCRQPPGRRPHVTVNSILEPDSVRTLMQHRGQALRELLQWCQQVGVDDFKFLPASRAKLITIFEQPGSWADFEALCQREVPARYPMFHYRLGNLRTGGHGLRGAGPHPCWFCLDDRAFDSGGAYPCIVRLREGAPPLFLHSHDHDTRLRNLTTFLAADRSQDPICRAHCYDIYRELSQAAASRLTDTEER